MNSAQAGMIEYVLLFLEGIITFISPCLLPMLPVYVSFFAAGQADKRRTMVNAVGFVCGFTLVFTLLGAFAGTIGRLLIRYTGTVNVISGVIVIMLGLHFLNVIHLRFLNRSGSAEVRDLRFGSSMVFGMVFSVSWTPCVSAFLGSALMMASSRGGIVNGMIMLLVYSLGLGIPFVISAVLIDRLKDAFNGIKSHYKVINAVSGALLIVTGIAMATGFMGRLLSLLSF